jgi:3-dehydroquinate synthase
MEQLKVDLGQRSYDILIAENLLATIGERLKALPTSSPKVAVLSNHTVFGLYGRGVMDSLKGAGFAPFEVVIPDGEEHKGLLWMEIIFGELLKNNMDRRSMIVALGGGVVGDMAGFAAASFMRGIPFVQVPTTLLSQVDSSVGGKTGVNHALGKNMIGAFWQPSLVLADLAVLRTLPERELIAGLSEVIKYGVIWDIEFFDFLIANKDNSMALDPETMAHIVKRSCEIKAEVVSKDEREGGLRAILNFGHTVGHAVETTTGYSKFLHGEALGIGMVYAARLAKKLGTMPTEDAQKVEEIVKLYGLPHRLPIEVSVEKLMEAMGRDKKSISGEVRFVLPTKIGSVEFGKPVEKSVLKEVLEGGH